MTYEEAGMELLKETGVVVKKWRTNMSGRAWYADRSIVTPYPKTAKSFEVFAHEIGHIVANPDHKAPSWKRELQASEYALDQFKRFKLKLPRVVKQRIYWYVTYSVCQALNRGMKKVPVEARKYTKGRIMKSHKTVFVMEHHLDGSRSGKWVTKGHRYYAR